MKGISLPVVPYALDLRSADDESLFEADADGLSLRLDLKGVDSERAARLRQRLLDAIEQLTSRIDKPPSGGPAPAE